MDWVPRLLAGIAATLAVIGFQGVSEPTPAQAPARVITPAVAPPSGLSVAPSTTLPPPPADARCPQWWPLARQAGWLDDQLPMLDKVMWKESNCQPHVHNTTLNKDGSSDIGLTQVNDWSWCLPTRWYPKGYLQTIGVLSTVGCNELFDPYINLLAAKAIHDYALEHNGNGWQPWRL